VNERTQNGKHSADNFPAAVGNDLGNFVIQELLRRGVVPPKMEQLPRLAATWMTNERGNPAGHHILKILTSGCRLAEVENFFRALLRQFMTPETEQFQEGSNVSFRTGNRDYHLLKQQSGFVLTISELVVVVGHTEDSVWIDLIKNEPG